ncbi:MAG: hypothetical protein N3H30_01780 [Candidatus Micrarchaeota archaeon]|nr:hypothetical protein [Candidatus Micrarchaeota archaeon]
MVSREHAYYPFLDSSKKAVRDAQLGGEIDERTLAAAKSRVISALKHRRIPLPAYFSSDDAVQDIKSYAVARLLVSLAGRRIENFIEAETSRALELCRRNGHERMLLSELGISVGDDLYVPLRDYLLYGSQFSGMVLSNRPVAGGRIKVSPHEITVLLKEAIRRKISEGLPIRESLISEDMKSMLKGAVSEIQAEVSLATPGFGRQSQDIAPCMEKILSDMQSGVKVRHLARWALATFLVKRGWDTDRIVQAFSGTPNFDEKTTRYQIDHIRAKGYNVPSCYNLKSQGICVADCGTKSPLQYRKPAAKQQD